MKRLSALIALVMLASVACGRSDQALSGMQLREEVGTVVVVRDGEINQVVGTFDLEPGDLVVTRNKSAATFALEGGDEVRKVELGSESQVLIEGPASIEARRGQVLVTAGDETVARFEGVRATASSAVFRIDRGFGSVRAGVYTGKVALAAPGQTRLAIAPFFEATVVAGDIPGLAQPYQMDVRDSWDAEHLGPYFELETQLRDLAAGFSNQVVSQRPGLDYFSALAQGDAVGFLKPYLERRPADLLIGFVVAQSAQTNLEDAFERAFELYDSGARWGIVAAIMEVKAPPLLAQLERLILGTGVAENNGGEAEFTVAAAEAAAGTDPSTGDQPDDGGTAPDPGEDPGGEDPKDPGGGDPPDECSGGAECTAEEVVDGVLGDDEEEDPPPQPEPSPTEEAEDDLLGGEGGLFD